MTSKNNLINKIEGNLQQNKCNSLSEFDLKVTPIA